MRHYSCAMAHQHQKAQTELILHFLGIGIQLTTSVEKDKPAFFVVTFQFDVQSLFDHSLDSRLVDIPMIKPLWHISFYRVEKVQFLFGAF